jgi:cytochrome bd-type quinol oxidase subunit 1
MVGFTVLYGVLAVIEFGLFTKTIKQGPPAEVADPYVGDKRQLTFSY